MPITDPGLTWQEALGAFGVIGRRRVPRHWVLAETVNATVPAAVTSWGDA
jgi:hypothetical protein